jgi:predicted amidohydrolase
VVNVSNDAKIPYMIHVDTLPDLPSTKIISAPDKQTGDQCNCCDSHHPNTPVSAWNRILPIPWRSKKIVDPTAGETGACDLQTIDCLLC